MVYDWHQRDVCLCNFPVVAFDQSDLVLVDSVYVMLRYDHVVLQVLDALYQSLYFAAFVFNSAVREQLRHPKPASGGEFAE